jgi:hypothetical protein
MATRDELGVGWVRNDNPRRPLRPQQDDLEEPPEFDSPLFCPECAMRLDLCECQEKF